MRPSRNTWTLGLVVALFVLLGCDEFGNPASDLQTAPTRWEEGPSATLTETVSVPTALAERLLRDLERAPDFSDRDASARGVVTRVEVRRERGATTGQLYTRLELADGTRVDREWRVTGGHQPWVAIFSLPEAPTAAFTRMR